jgi:HD-GYP domain-containing protein (c-di-GMP phosphodiesterase class II)
LGLSEKEQATLALGGELHDIGKIGIHETLLNKPAPLTADEYRDVMQHTVIGERILKPLLRSNSAVLGIVRWHHEHIGGGSLPDGLTGEEIPLEARIVSVADAFDAMTSERPYRLPMSAAGALHELEVAAGTQFDEDCVYACAVAMHDRVQAIAS